MKSKCYLFNWCRIKTAQLTNKCTDDDLEYYIKECGYTMGVSQLVNNADDAKEILHAVFMELIKLKSNPL